MIEVTMTGNVTADAAIKTTPANQKVANFTLAVNRMNPTTKERKTDFVRCAVWNETAVAAEKYVKKGRRMMVRGIPKASHWVRQDGTIEDQLNVSVSMFEFQDGQKTETPEAPAA